MKTFVLIASSFLLISCSSNDVSTTEIRAAKDVPVTVIPTSDTTPHANLYIEGMSCEKMCVGAINKTLSSIDGVEVDEVDFDADRPVDVFSVSYDPEKVDEIQLIEAIHGIAGGVYSVKEVELMKKVQTTSSLSGTNSTAAWSYFDRQPVSNNRFQIPNVFDAFKRLTGI